MLATATADLSTLLGPGRSSSGLGYPVYDPATGQVAVSLQGQFSGNTAPKVRDFTVFADPATKKATTVPGINAAGVLNGVVVGVKGSQQEGAKDNAIVQADGVTGSSQEDRAGAGDELPAPDRFGRQARVLRGTGYVKAPRTTPTT